MDTIASTAQRAATPLDISRARRRPPFHQGMTRRGVPDLHKIGGYIAAVDGRTPERIQRGHVAAVYYDAEVGEWRIGKYWGPPEKKELQTYGAATARTVKDWTNRGVVRRIGSYDSYAAFVDDIRRTYPGIWAPPAAVFFAEFGLSYDPATGAISNPRNLQEGRGNYERV